MDTKGKGVSFSTIAKVAMTAVLLLCVGAWWYYANTRADTTLGLTLTTNPDLENGLVGHWTFDGPDMLSDVADTSGQDNHGALVNYTSTTTSGGVLGQALEFGKNPNRYVTISNGSGDLDPGTGDFTVSFWYKEAPSGNFLSDDLTGVDGLWEIGTSVDEGRYYFSAPGFVTFSFGSFALPTDSGWHHVVFRLERNTSPDTFSVYVDGVSTPITGQTNTLDGAAIISSSVRIGGPGFFAQAYRDTPMDDVRIYNRAISLDEIRRLYELGGTTHISQTIGASAGQANGLTGHWTFDGEDMLSNVADVSGNGHHGYLMGATATTVTPGPLGQALALDADGYVTTGLNYSNFITASEGTVSVWMRPTGTAPDVAAEGGIWSGRMAVSGSAVGGMFGITQANRTDLGEDKIWAYNGDAFGTYDSVGVPYTQGEWLHVTWVHGGGTLSIYKNGEFVDSTASGNTGDANILYIANNWIALGGNGRKFRGDLDDVRTYNRKLSADEIRRVYQLGATTHIAQTINENPALAEDGLVGHWTFDGETVDWSSTTAEIRDSSPQGHNGDANSMSAQSVTPGIIGQALTFDGVSDYVDVGTSSDFIPSGSKSMTYAFWYKGLGGATDTFLGHSPQALTNFWYIRKGVALFCGGINCSKSVSNNYVLPDDDAWHHVAVVLDAAPNPDTLSVYIDGAYTDSGGGDRNDGSGTWGSNTRIGDGNWATTGKRQGAMDDVRIYNRALSAAEIQRLYQMGQ